MEAKSTPQVDSKLNTNACSKKKLEHKTRKPFKTPYVTPKCMTEQNVIDQHWYGACRPESKFHLGAYQIKAAFFLLCYKHI